jgi:hypothetical protein|tara:strand:- start:40 stop:468 length:429 start_codon:yes stop_codon:yes gene_type:complete
LFRAGDLRMLRPGDGAGAGALCGRAGAGSDAAAFTFASTRSRKRRMRRTWSSSPGKVMGTRASSRSRFSASFRERSADLTASAAAKRSFGDFDADVDALVGRRLLGDGVGKPLEPDAALDDDADIGRDLTGVVSREWRYGES